MVGMRNITRRGVLGAGLGAAAAIGVAGCGTGSGNGKPGKGSGGADGGNGGGGDGKGPGPQAKPARLIGDGSTADTGKQPHQPDGAGTARARSGSAAIRDLFVGRCGRGRQRPLPAVPGTRQEP